MTATVATTTPSKAKKLRTASVAKKTKAPATHPPVSDMVLAAVKSLKERNGSSAQAIKKYIGTNYKVEMERLQPFIKKFLKSAVTSGSLTQTKGKGANGSFKLGANQTKEKTTTKPKPAVKSTPKKSVKKASSPSVVTKAKKTIKKSETKTKSKSPKKVTKAVEKKSKTVRTAKSPKKAVKPKPVKKTPKKVPQKSTRKR